MFNKKINIKISNLIISFIIIVAIFGSIIGITYYNVTKEFYDFKTVNKYLNNLSNEFELQLYGEDLIISGYKLDTFNKEVTIPSEIEGKNIVAIGYQAFAKSKIIKITIPDTVTEIMDEAFSECSELETVDFPCNTEIKIIGIKAFYKCVKIKRLYLDSNIEYIGRGAFSSLSGLEELYIQNINTIGARAFMACSSLKKIYINYISNTDNGIFYSCNALEEIHISATIQILSWKDFFEEDNITSKIYVQSQLVESYKSSYEWQKLINNIYAEPII